MKVKLTLGGGVTRMNRLFTRAKTRLWERIGTGWCSI